jgi:hypothetical protein
VLLLRAVEPNNQSVFKVFHNEPSQDQQKMGDVINLLSYISENERQTELTVNGNDDVANSYKPGQKYSENNSNYIGTYY